MRYTVIAVRAQCHGLAHSCGWKHWANATRGKARSTHISEQCTSQSAIPDLDFVDHLWCRELVPNMRAAVDPFHWPQFIDSNADFAKNTVQEAIDRETHSDRNIHRDIQSYMMMRRETIGTRPCLVLMRSTRRLYITDDVLANPILKEMEDVALDMVYIVNVRYNLLTAPHQNWSCLLFYPGRLLLQEGVWR